jgi:hypothetical protein
VNKRAYLNIQVLREIYVSSSGHYFGKMRYVHNGQRFTRDVDLNNGTVLALDDVYPVQLPQYVMRRVWELYLEAFEHGHNDYYEYDRDGNKRYDNLRYFSYEGEAWITECLRRDLGIATSEAEAQHGAGAGE